MLQPEQQEPQVGPFQFYIEAFYELSSCRVSSMALGPIPFTAIVEYARLFDLSEFEDFHYYIRAMDNALLKLEAERNRQTGTNKK